MPRPRKRTRKVGRAVPCAPPPARSVLPQPSTKHQAPGTLRAINNQLTTINYLRKRRRHRLNLALRGDNDRVTADTEARRADHGAALAWG